MSHYLCSSPWLAAEAAWACGSGLEYRTQHTGEREVPHSWFPPLSNSCQGLNTGKVAKAEERTGQEAEGLGGKGLSGGESESTEQHLQLDAEWETVSTRRGLDSG